MLSQGLGGVAATRDKVIVSGRDPTDNFDIFICLDAEKGQRQWQVLYPAAGKLDYGNSPRATPLIQDGLVFLYGAFGNLTCVDLQTGKTLWRRDLLFDFHVERKLIWGTSSSPLIVDGKLIVNPGGKDASLVALEPKSGEVIWKVTGNSFAYASFMVAELGGVRQLVGYDQTTLGGWNLEDGARLWTLKPPRSRDFNVPTPIPYKGRLVVTTENNGTRMYDFGDDGKIEETPIATHIDLSPDTMSPVRIGNRLFGVWDGLYCLDLDNGLEQVWLAEDDAYFSYTTLIGGPDRLMASTLFGEFLIIDATADDYRELSRVSLLPGEAGLYSHPAIVGDRLYVRASKAVMAFSLDTNE